MDDTNRMSFPLQTKQTMPHKSHRHRRTAFEDIVRP